MKPMKSWFLFGVCHLACGAAIAQTNVPHEFESGQPARASEVNENFSALASAIDSNRMSSDANSLALQQLMSVTSNESAVVLSLTSDDSCTISEPGHYILDRDWNLGISQATCFAGAGDGESMYVHVTASSVLFDLRGYSLTGPTGPGVVILQADGSDVVVRNGKILGGQNSAADGNAIVSQGANNHFWNVESNDVSLGGQGGSLTASVVNGHVGIRAPNFLVENTSVVPADDEDPFSCIEVSSSASKAIVRNNRCRPGLGGGIYVSGDGSLVEGNIILEEATASFDGPEYGIQVSANEVMVVRNILLSTGAQQGSTAIVVSGTTNIIDSNLVSPMGYTDGIEVPGAGNFVGGNRVGVSGTPYMGTADDVDWGGNVSF